MGLAMVQCLGYQASKPCPVPLCQEIIRMQSLVKWLVQGGSGYEKFFRKAAPYRKPISFFNLKESHSARIPQVVGNMISSAFKEKQFIHQYMGGPAFRDSAVYRFALGLLLQNDSPTTTTFTSFLNLN